MMKLPSVKEHRWYVYYFAILPLNTTVRQTYGRTEQYICCIS